MPTEVLEEGLVLDLDVQKFFDSVDHALMVKAVEANTDLPWVVLYAKRWLIAPLQLPDGRRLSAATFAAAHRSCLPAAVPD
ncbi:hypothetical protein [Streptomyces sp. NPDC054866]